MPAPYADATAKPSSTLAAVLVLVGIFALGLFLAQALAVGLLALVMGPSAQTITEYLAAPEAYGDLGRVILLVIQGISTIGAFIIAPLLYLRYYERQPMAMLSPKPIADWTELAWTALLVPVLMPLLELTVDWNKSLHLPSQLAGLERWAADKETVLARLTEFLIAFPNLGQFALGLLVVAVLPAVGEELLFRGTLQPILQRATGSPHRAIWITAIVFSAIHLQFFGFVPRMLLGALFGYLYYWSGNVRVPMLAHFVNNGLTVTLSYIAQRNKLGFDPINMPPSPAYVVVLSALAGGAVLYRFRQKYFLAAPWRQV